MKTEPPFPKVELVDVIVVFEIEELSKVEIEMIEVVGVHDRASSRFIGVCVPFVPN
jgi:hypothetical protein